MDQSSLPWPEQLQEESLISIPNDDEFANLFDFGIQFPDLDGQSARERHHPIPSTSAADSDLIGMDTDSRMPDHFAIGTFSQPHGQSQAQAPTTYSNSMAPGYYANETSQHEQFNGQPQKPQSMSREHSLESSHQQSASKVYGHPVIPPTPNSVELQGNAMRYPQRLDEDHGLYDPYARMNEEQVSHNQHGPGPFSNARVLQIYYTPLISPAMTPLETQFRLPEYTIPGEYFTPLTSPAIEAQNPNSNGVPQHTNQVSDLRYQQSPVDNPLPVSSAPPSPGIVKRHRRRISATVKPTNRAKKSPAVRPQRRKKSVLNSNSDEVLNILSQNQNSTLQQANGSAGTGYGSNESASKDSISPETLSEPLMPPPALPPPKQSPSVGPQMGGAATPATLMHINRSRGGQSAVQSPGQTRPSSGEPHDDIMEDVVLPEAATPTTGFYRPNGGRIVSHSDTANAAASANTTPCLEPKSAATDPPSSSVAPSPRSIAMPSPSGPTGKKLEPAKSGTFIKKRPSLSSTQPSPQLRPKISPCIQPLGRAGDGKHLPSNSPIRFLLSH